MCGTGKTHQRKGETPINSKPSLPKLSLPKLEKLIISALDRLKAENIVSIDLKGKSDFADKMVIASGTSGRHIDSLASSITGALKDAGLAHIPVEGKESGEWVLVDAGDIIVHLFRPDIRNHYNLEKMWSVPMASSRLESVV